MNNQDERQLIEKLERERQLSKDEYIQLLNAQNKELEDILFAKARKVQKEYYGNRIYIRGLIETTNYCKNDCYYCGIRRSNQKVKRYRLTTDVIMACCKRGYELGFRTFVLQGGEDPWWTDERIVDVVRKIRAEYSDCALTLSLGEKTKESYQAYYEAGANRYLLRHETADAKHYQQLHPPELTLSNRKQCLRYLQEIGYQVGTGMMVGSPGQTTEHLAEDLLWLQELQPQKVGIGPFISHHDTPLAEYQNGTLEQTIYLLGIVRLMLPMALIPATTALATIDPKGRERGIMAGANVIMPNLSPVEAKENYTLYDNKLNTGLESAAGLADLKQRMAQIGYQIVVDRGDAYERRGKCV